jgi:CHAT domain-containing protein
MVKFIEDTAVAGVSDVATAQLWEFLADRGTSFGWPNEAVGARQIKAAQAYQTVGDLVRAERLWSAALLTVGDDPGVINSAAEARRQLGQFDAAWPLYERALAKIDRKTQADSVATVVHNQGLLRLQQGRYDEAEKLLLDSVHLQEASGSKDPLALSYPLNDLGELRRHQGRFDEALAFFERALALRERSAGKQSAVWASVRQNMALVHQARGDFTTAYTQMKEANAALTASTAESDLRVLTLAINLAVLQRDLGAPWEALDALDAAGQRVSQFLGPEHPLRATIYEQLGLTQRALLRPRAALDALRKAHALREKVLPAAHPDRARSLLNVAVACDEAGEGAEADKLLEQATVQLREAFGDDHPLLATAAHSRGLRALQNGDAAKALPLFQAALATRRKTSAPEAVDTLEALALTQLVLGARAEGLAALTQLIEDRERQRATTLAVRSDLELVNVSTELAWESARLSSIHLAFLADDPAAARLVLTQLLRTRARGLDAYLQTRRALRASPKPNAEADLLRREAELRSAIASTESTDDARLYSQALSAVQRKLAKRGGPSASSVTIAGVTAMLTSTSALIEVHQALPLDRLGNAQGAPFYVAYVLTKAGVQARRLGDVKAVDDAVTALRAAASTPSGNVEQPAATLHDLVWKPLQLDPSVTQIFMAAMGELAVAPLGLMAPESGKPIMGSVEIVAVTSGRDLIRSGASVAKQQPPLLIANPDFGSADAKGMAFDPLPATLQEASNISKTIKNATLLTGGRATKQALLAARHPRVLHLATHGYYLSEAAPPITASSRGLKLRTKAPAPDTQRSEGAQLLSNPLAMSGLALAGANLADGSGVMTAAEVAGLDLFGTQLVVLSACQTGMGQRVGGEGVMGLRRALIQAGSQTQVLSLWNVDDDATSELMSRYYAGLAKGMGRSAALRAAQLQLQTGKYAHPYYWAAFVMSGDPRPLR